jgi:hypothetical protein
MDGKNNRDNTYILWLHSPSLALTALSKGFHTAYKYDYSSILTLSLNSIAFKRAKQDITRSTTIQKLVNELSNSNTPFFEGISATATPSILLLALSFSQKTKMI